MTRFDADRMARIRLMQEREALEKAPRDFLPQRPVGGYMAGLGRGVGRMAGGIGNVGSAVKTGFQEARAQGQQMNQQMQTMGADKRAQGQAQFEQARQAQAIPVPQAVGQTAQQATAATTTAPMTVGGGGGQVQQGGGGGGSGGGGNQTVPTPSPPVPQGLDPNGNMPLPPTTPGGGPQTTPGGGPPTTPGGGGPQGGGPQQQQTQQQQPQQQGQQGPQSRAGQQALANLYSAQAGAGMQQAQQKQTGGVGYNPLAMIATGGLSALGQLAYNRYKTGQNQKQGQQQMAQAQQGLMQMSADDDMMASADRIHKGMAYLQYRGVE